MGYTRGFLDVVVVMPLARFHAMPQVSRKRETPSGTPFIFQNITTTSNNATSNRTCLLYTSDAADEEDSVDLGGRRIIKKKKRKKERMIGLYINCVNRNNIFY
eukprot:TRINITY_DN31523_c0_g1_i2.p1 TRINITY_DN31523_c0_g1~~TRINITY_DN31523_c0_g1_i2.p1  ORF type:complete len:103 (-),score=5.54 TRINITY_DN31523_c0_g1_i2:37-345(-)